VCTGVLALEGTHADQQGKGYVTSCNCAFIPETCLELFKDGIKSNDMMKLYDPTLYGVQECVHAKSGVLCCLCRGLSWQSF
jgi:hypothetical protein